MFFISLEVLNSSLSAEFPYNRNEDDETTLASQFKTLA